MLTNLKETSAVPSPFVHVFVWDSHLNDTFLRTVLIVQTLLFPQSLLPTNGLKHCWKIQPQPSSFLIYCLCLCLALSLSLISQSPILPSLHLVFIFMFLLFSPGFLRVCEQSKTELMINFTRATQCRLPSQKNDQSRCLFVITETIEHVFAIFCVCDDLGSMEESSKTFFKGYLPPLIPPSPADSSGRGYSYKWKTANCSQQSCRFGN